MGLCLVDSELPKLLTLTKAFHYIVKQNILCFKCLFTKLGLSSSDWEWKETWEGKALWFFVFETGLL